MSDANERMKLLAELEAKAAEMERMDPYVREAIANGATTLGQAID
jgi:hypothetical protein